MKLGSLQTSLLFPAQAHLFCMGLAALILCPLKRLFKEMRVVFIVPNNILLFAGTFLQNMCTLWTAESHFLNIQCFSKYWGGVAFAGKMQTKTHRKAVSLPCCDTNRYLSPAIWSSYCIYFSFYSLCLQA